jgi:PIN domain nuclease of toxin-antitoxin system
LAISSSHLDTLMGLPAHHRDSFDHRRVAQAIADDAEFVTADRHAPAYGVRVVGSAG